MRNKTMIVAAALFGLAGSVFSTSALADTFSGVCTFSGTATITPPIGAMPASGAFSFVTNTSLVNRCSGVLNGNEVTQVKASAVANGNGRLSCAASTGSGIGTLTIQGKPIDILLTIVGSGPQVTLIVQGTAGGAATGQASFATDTTAANKCEKNKAGVLTFLVAATAEDLAD